jgi:predicted aconitase
MAASGAVALYHIPSLTPEATATEMLAPDAEHIVIDDLRPGYGQLNGKDASIDLVSIGCPHASAAQIQEVARLLAGRHLRSALWVTTARETRDRTEHAVRAIEAAGGRVVADTCLVVAPVAELGFRTMATNSAKMAYYAPSHSGLSVRFGTLRQCLDAAVSGVWPGAAPQ